MSTPRERLHYRVSALLVVKSDDVSVLAPTSGSTLTLITCYPFWFIGQAPDRFVVRATQVRASERAASETVPHTSGQGDPGVVWSGFERSGRGSASAGESPISQRPADVLVREAVERFRQIYNGRSASRWATQAGRPLVFLTCVVQTNADRATATCQSIPVSAVDHEPLLWLFNLREERGRWSIQDVSTQ
jgi:hypothetical protein